MKHNARKTPGSALRVLFLAMASIAQSFAFLLPPTTCPPRHPPSPFLRLNALPQLQHQIFQPLTQLLTGLGLRGFACLRRTNPNKGRNSLRPFWGIFLIRGYVLPASITALSDLCLCSVAVVLRQALSVGRWWGDSRAGATSASPTGGSAVTIPSSTKSLQSGGIPLCLRKMSRMS